MMRIAPLVPTILLLAAAAAHAQTTPNDRVYLDLGGGVKASPTKFSATTHPVDNAEAATVESRYKTKTAPMIDIGGGVRVWRSLSIGVDVTRFSRDGAADVQAQVPHPFFFDRDRAVSGSASDLSRVETGVHVQARWTRALAGRWLLAFGGGPSYIAIEQDVVEGVSVNQTYPFDTATFAGVRDAAQKRSGLGFNVGADFTRVFSPKVGAGVSVGYSHARVELPGVAGEPLTVDAGGASVTGGLRFRFAGPRAGAAPGSARAPRRVPSSATAAPTKNARWEIEGHAGGGFDSGGSDGSSGGLPPAGPAFTTAVGFPSRRASSWYFGDGAILLNDILTSFRTVTGRITSLDPVLGRAGAARENGASFGFRVARAITARFGAEFTLDAPRGTSRLGDDLLSGVEASRASFIRAFDERTGLIATGVGTVFVNPTITSVTQTNDGTGRQLFTTGALIVSLGARGRWSPYAALGGGVVSNLGDPSNLDLVGTYAFTSPGAGGTFRVTETDTVTIRIVPAKDHAPVAVLGGGVRIAMSRRTGLRGDVRAYLGSNTADVLIDAHPRVTTGSPTVTISSALTPSIQFSNDPTGFRTSTLSGAAIDGFTTFRGSGLTPHVALSVGYFVSF